MKKMLKNQSGLAAIAVILIIVVVVAGGGAAALGIRMAIAGDGNYLKPFEDLGWIEPKEDDDDDAKEKSSKKKSKDEDEDEDEDDDDDDDDNKKEKEKEKEKTVANMAKYLVEATRLSADAKKSGVAHYYGDIPLSEEMAATGEDFADYYKLLQAGINVYAKDGKAVEIEFGFDITDFCKALYNNYGTSFASAGITSEDGLVKYMMSMIETMFDNMEENYSDYITKYVDGGKLQLYVTEQGFDSIYEEYNITKGEKDVDKIIDALEEAFKTEINLVKD